MTVLGRRGLRGALLLLAAEIAFIVALRLLFHWRVDAVSLFWLLPTAIGVAVHYRTVIRLEPDALVIVSSRRTQRFLWSDVLETSWFRGSGMWQWSGPVIRVRGGAYDEPGPNVPAQVGSVLLLSRRANKEAADQLAEAAERQGVPFTPNLQQLINSGKRRPRLPGEA